MSSTPNNTIIEMSAVNKLKEALLRTEHVEPDIRDNDKTPSWDGEMRLYSGKNFCKDDLVGKIPVQVKGKWVARLQHAPVKFDVDMRDLENYQNDGGAILFVIHMKDFDSYRIYYRCLLPLDLRRLTSCSKDQKTKRIIVRTQKETTYYINCNRKFWNSLHDVDTVIIMGHSLGNVDIPYFNDVKKRTTNTTKWIYYYFGEQPNKNDIAEKLGVVGSTLTLLPSCDFFD